MDGEVAVNGSDFLARFEVADFLSIKAMGRQFVCEGWVRKHPGRVSVVMPGVTGGSADPI